MTTLKKTLKYNHTKTKNKKNIYRPHYYFISKCEFDDISYLEYDILESYLKKIQLLPDIMQYTLEEKDKIQCKAKGITYNEFCNFHKNVRPTIIKNPKDIKADVFFYNLYSSFLDARLYQFKKYLVNTLNINRNIVSKKNLLYDNINKIIQYPNNIHNTDDLKYFIKTFPINQIENYNFPMHYILRPNDGSSGQDILYINTQKQLDNAFKYYNTHKNFKGVIYGNDVIASRYITDLLLFKNKKFHLRMYYMISCINKVFNSFLLNDCKIITAKEEFNMKAPFTKAKHDTHFKNTDSDLFFSTDFNSGNIGIHVDNTVKTTIYNNCKSMCQLLSKMIINKITGYIIDNMDDKIKNINNFFYDNQKNGYHIFGLDVFITKDLTPILIECNYTPGYSSKTHTNNIIFSKMYFEWINDVILEPLFKYNDLLIARKHITYIN